MPLSSSQAQSPNLRSHGTHPFQQTLQHRKHRVHVQDHRRLRPRRTNLPPSCYALHPSQTLSPRLHGRSPTPPLPSPRRPLKKKKRLTPSNIDVLVVTCSLFCPSPSLSSIVANHFKLLQDVKTFNISETGKGFVGFTVKRDIIRTIREVNPSNATSLWREILTLEEKLRYILWCMRNILLRKREHNNVFLPDFGRAMQHYCFPTISKGVIEEIGRGLGLREKDMEAGLSTFHRFGNTSAASLWYQLGYIKSKVRMKKGDKLWMIAFGSGCKCNSKVWECIKEVKGEGGPWEKCIDNYPLDS